MLQLGCTLHRTAVLLWKLPKARLYLGWLCSTTIELEAPTWSYLVYTRFYCCYLSYLGYAVLHRWSLELCSPNSSWGQLHSWGFSLMKAVAKYEWPWCYIQVTHTHNNPWWKPTQVMKPMPFTTCLTTQILQILWRIHCQIIPIIWFYYIEFIWGFYCRKKPTINLKYYKIRLLW